MKWLLPKRRLGAREPPGPNRRSDISAWHNCKFDESTGQLYLETTTRIQSSDDKDWTRKIPLVSGLEPRWSEDYLEYRKGWEHGSSDEPLATYQGDLDGVENSGFIGFKGTRTLEDSAIECVLQNLSDITLEGIECLPIDIVRRLWYAVNKRRLLCFNTWSIFSKILRHDDMLQLHLLRYRQAIEIPKSPLHIYANPLTSKSFDFITSLSITTSFPIPNLVKLSSLTNLGVLEIINAPEKNGCWDAAVGDRLVRAWHFAAMNDSAFRVLRILRLWYHEDLTTKSLAYINSFPALAVYDVQGCGFNLESKIKASRFGWKATLDTNILGLLEAACADRAVLMQCRLGIESKSVQKAGAQQLWDRAKIQRIPRTNVPTFLTRPEASLPGKRAVECFEVWDLANYKIFARIGELRNDTDLARAGVFIVEQALVGNEIVSSVPIVSLRLGGSPSCLQPHPINRTPNSVNTGMYSKPPASFAQYDWKEQPRLANSSLRGLCFIRIKAIPPENASAKSETQAFLRPASKNVVVDAPGPQTASLASHASAVRRNKKRKLEDVLDSFL